MKFLSNNNKSPLLHTISILNPFKIISDFENERTGVKRLEIVEVIGVLLIYYFIIGTSVSIATTIHNNIISSLLLIVTFFIVTIVCKLLIVNIDNDNAKSVKKFTIKSIIFLIIIFLGYFLIVCSLILPFEKTLQGFENNMTFAKYLAKTPLFMIIYACILGPVMEETVFRGIILGGLLKRYSNTTAILVSALLFGIIHLNLAQFMLAFPLGLLIGYLYMKTHSIYLCMLLHGLNNTFSFVFALYYPYRNIYISILFIVVGLALIIMGFKKIIVNLNNSNIQKTLNCD